MAVDTQLTVSGLVAFTAPKAVLLRWDKGEDGCLPYLERDVYEVWRASTNDRTQATKIAEPEANTYTDHDFNNSQSWYYWVRVRNVDGEEGPWHPTSATGGVEAAPVNYATSGSLGGNASDVDVGAGKAVAETGADRTLSQGASLLVYSATAPSHVEGRVWIKSDDGDIFRSVSGAWVKIGSNDALRLNNAPAEAGADSTAGKPLSSLSGVGALALLNQASRAEIVNGAVSSVSASLSIGSSASTTVDATGSNAVLVLGVYRIAATISAGGSVTTSPRILYNNGGASWQPASVTLYNHDTTQSRGENQMGSIMWIDTGATGSQTYTLEASGGNFSAHGILAIALKR